MSLSRCPSRSLARLIVLLALPLALSAQVYAQDWTQWRGSSRNGIASPSPSLADEWPKEGPAKLWDSEKIPAMGDGGFASVSVVGDKGYLFVNWKDHVPIATRKLPSDKLAALGWFDANLPDDLKAAVEAARVSDDRLKLKGDDLKVWVDKWVKENVKDPNSPLAPMVRDRLNRGKGALPLDVLAKLPAIKGKEFASVEEFDKWFADNAVPDDAKKEILKQVPTTKEEAKDVILCLNIQDGKTVWKKEYPGQPSGWGSSSTPCLADGKCYVAGGKTLYCLDAASGEELWKTPLKGGDVSSSPLLVDGLVVVLGGQLTAVHAKDGSPAWADANLTGANSSPAVWSKDGQSYVLCNVNIEKKGVLACVKAGTGETVWTVPGGGSGTAALAGDMAVVLSEDQKVGLVAYKLSADTAEKLWSVEMRDRGTTPIIYENNVYVATAGGKALCVGLQDGKTAWEQKYGGEISSPILADGKVLAYVDGGKALLMFKASPEAHTVLAKVAMPIAHCSSPSLAAGKLFVRSNSGVSCYDLTKKSQ